MEKEYFHKPKVVEQTVFTPSEEAEIYKRASEREIKRDTTGTSLSAILQAGTEAGINQKTLEECAQEVVAERKDKIDYKLLLRNLSLGLGAVSVMCSLSFVIGYGLNALFEYSKQETPTKQEKVVELPRDEQPVSGEINFGLGYGFRTPESEALPLPRNDEFLYGSE